MPCGVIEMPLTPEQAARMCGVGVGVIYAAVKSGALRARHKRGQTKRLWILRADLEAWASGGMFEGES